MSRALVLLVVLLAFAPASGARAWCQATSVQQATAGVCDFTGVPFAWKRRCFTYALDERGTPSVSNATVLSVLDRSFAHWEGVRCSGLALGFEFREARDFATCRDAEYTDRTGDGNMNIIAFVSDFRERKLSESAFAVTITWHAPSTGELYDADMLINELQGPFGVCPDAGCTDDSFVDLENVITHEAGHFLGLSHSADSDSTMFWSAGRGEISKRSLGADDIAGICAIYPPGSLPNSCRFTPRHGRDLNCEVETTGRCSASSGANADLGPLGALLIGCVALAAAARARARR